MHFSFPVCKAAVVCAYAVLCTASTTSETDTRPIRIDFYDLSIGDRYFQIFVIYHAWLLDDQFQEVTALPLGVSNILKCATSYCATRPKLLLDSAAEWDMLAYQKFSVSC